jgi:thiamine-phosphate pyrophosphorylase
VDRLTRARLARAAQRLNRGRRARLPALVLMTDDERLPDPIVAAKELPRGSMIIVRARQTSHRAKLAEALHPITREREIKLVIANDPILARRVRADGVHFSEDRAREAARWRVRHPKWVITTAAHSLHSCRIASVALADAAILAPVFPTKSHLDRYPLGPARARLTARHAPLPVYALGGINAQNSASLRGAFVGIAAIGALTP